MRRFLTTAAWFLSRSLKPHTPSSALFSPLPDFLLVINLPWLVPEDCSSFEHACSRRAVGDVGFCLSACCSWCWCWCWCWTTTTAYVAGCARCCMRCGRTRFAFPLRYGFFDENPAGRERASFVDLTDLRLHATCCSCMRRANIPLPSSVLSQPLRNAHVLTYSTRVSSVARHHQTGLFRNLLPRIT